MYQVQGQLQKVRGQRPPPAGRQHLHRTNAVYNSHMVIGDFEFRWDSEHQGGIEGEKKKYKKVAERENNV